MSQLKYYFDAHISTAVATELRKRGVDVLRCQEIGLTQAGDPQHLDYAAQEGRVVVTHDSDFVDYHTQWQNAGKTHAGIMRLHRDLQGEDNIGRIVKVLFDYHQLIEHEVGNLQDDMVNHLYFIKG